MNRHVDLLDALEAVSKYETGMVCWLSTIRMLADPALDTQGSIMDGQSFEAFGELCYIIVDLDLITILQTKKQVPTWELLLDIGTSGNDFRWQSPGGIMFQHGQLATEF